MNVLSINTFFPRAFGNMASVCF